MITLGLQDYTATDEPSAKNSGVTSSIAPPLTAADRGPRGGDLPYAYIDPRWLRSYLPTVNARAKHLTRNNRHAKTAALNVPTDIVGSGIHPTLPEEQATIWHKWASRRRRINTSKRLTWQGLQWLIVRSVMVTGEAFIVMRRRRMNDSTGLIPLSIEIFDADGLSDAPARGMRARATFDQGREIGPNGRVLAWHFRIDAGFRDRYLRVPASDVVHVYDPDDCAGRRGISWFSPVVIDLSELSGYQDSTAVKQHLASKLTVITSDPSMFTQMMKPGDPIPDLDPGNIITVEPGRTVESFQPPANRDYRDFVKVNRDEIAMCLGAVPEDLSGDYRGMSWTVARASYLKHWTRNAGHRERWLRPALEDVYDWVQWAMGGPSSGWLDADEMDWRMPVKTAIDPDREGIANLRLVRAGFRSWSDIVKDSGRDPEKLMLEIASERKKFDGLDIVVDSDPNKVTMTGQLHPAPPESVARESAE